MKTEQSVNGHIETNSFVIHKKQKNYFDKSWIQDTQKEKHDDNFIDEMFDDINDFDDFNIND